MLMSLDTSTTSCRAAGRVLGVEVAQRLDDAQDLVVGLALRQAGRQVVVERRRSGRTACRRLRGGRWCRASGPCRCRRPGRRPARRACGWSGGRCARLRSCPSCGRRVLPARSSAGRCRVPRSGTGTSGRAAARWCPARTAWPGRWVCCAWRLTALVAASAAGCRARLSLRCRARRAAGLSTSGSGGASMARAAFRGVPVEQLERLRPARTGSLQRAASDVRRPPFVRGAGGRVVALRRKQGGAFRGAGGRGMGRFARRKEGARKRKSRLKTRAALFGWMRSRSSTA